MGFVSEFKEFAMKGNVIDLAVGVIIGGAFGKIVTSLTDDIINPVLGLVLGKVDFSAMFIDLSGKGYATLKLAEEAKAPVLKYGSFINSIIQFLIMAVIIFFMVKAINSLKREAPPAPAAPPEPTNEEKLLGEIRDLLKQRA